MMPHKDLDVFKERETGRFGWTRETSYTSKIITRETDRY